MIAESSNLFMFWDTWVDGKTLAEFFSPLFDQYVFICDYVVAGSWCLPGFFPLSIRQLILAIPILDSSFATLDSRDNTKPCFKTFRLNFFDGLQKVDRFRFIWHKRVALRYSSCIWLLVRDGLKMAGILAKRNIINHSTCSLC